MLALARGEGQSIIIDGTIEVKIVKWSRSSVRIAIQAPREITVDRDEIWRKMHPGELTPLEKAEKERNERFAREGITPHPPHHPNPPHPSQQPAAPAPPHAAPHAEIVPVLATHAGKCWVRPTPDAAPFVSVGSVVDGAIVLALIESGDEQFHEIRLTPPTHTGAVARILVSNGQQVTPGQPLFHIKPHEAVPSGPANR